MSAKVLVIGGTGKTGRLVAKGLMERGIAHRIGTRSPATESDVAFDWQQPELARRAFDGIDAVYVVAPTNSSDHGAIVPPVLDLALSSGVQRFVLLSASSLEAGGPMMGQVHAYLQEKAPEWTVLRPTWFMQNFSEQQHLATIRDENAIYSATGGGRVGFIDAGDIANAAVAALVADESRNTDFILTGPEALSYADMAAKLTEVLGRRIEHVNLTVEQLAGRYRHSGMDERYAQMLAAMDARIEQGSEDCVTDGVVGMTGHPPTTVDEFILRNKARWERT
ncbi:ergot alkaloid biosynthesis protein [Microvirga lotononidis]|uniref:Ergot alkaloid biosynthesis protein, AFUA_2G17970 family n=1 Tax=Microvirga lotononidis TaxID=864069 RepID=I4Z1V5_9HYPH|nr:ergot alkaloid biosynthesis protein [Microvirga lotononidis]EIM30197.1 ergot alkaloid biosynthesis protein, AFUA_2G17970 family [Microvirga lotononidis]WQO31579.1 ergot alkaloid biosynthesis protein [Microvirga lotononidis]